MQGVPGSTKKKTQEEVIEILQEIYPDYDFSQFEYKGQLIDSKVICPYHGPFQMHYKKMTRGGKCKDCKLGTQEEFIKQAEAKFPGACEYHKVKYVSPNVHVEIICKKHGPFMMKPCNYFNQSVHPCPKCGIEARIEKQWDNQETFLAKARAYKGDEYDFSEVVYRGSKEYITLRCKKGHPSFQTTPNWFLTGHGGCARCSVTGTSRAENEIEDFVKNLGFATKPKMLADRTRIDIYIEELKIGIEYNGLYYHSESGPSKRGKDYHLNKTLQANSEGIFLIQIFEDEWVFKKTICKARLQSILNKSLVTIGARNTEVEEISLKDSELFLEEHHIQGKGSPSSVRLALKHNGYIVSLMTFCHVRNEEGPESHFELLRFVSSCNVRGAFSKLLNYFVKVYQPKRIVSYSDNRWSLGKVYEINGFSLLGETGPNYFWCKGQKRYPRQMFQKHKLESLPNFKFNHELTEEQNCVANNYCRLHDCGNKKWELKFQ